MACIARWRRIKSGQNSGHFDPAFADLRSIDLTTGNFVSKVRQMSNANETLIKKVAELEAQLVSNSQICDVIGCDASTLNRLQETDLYKQFLSAAKQEYLARDRNLDNGWNSIEEKAISIVKENLKYNLNPEFALRAAVLANKANRRGRQDSILPSQMGSRSVINMNTIFIGKLQAPPKEE